VRLPAVVVGTAVAVTVCSSNYSGKSSVHLAAGSPSLWHAANLRAWMTGRTYSPDLAR